nr:hypothetical protein BaRGS_022518 [Batillaria attramentaria]
MMVSAGVDIFLSTFLILKLSYLSSEGLSRKDPTELLDLLRKARDDKSREPIRQTLLTRKLRRLAEAKKLADVSKFLTVSDASIQTAVGVILEKQLLQLQLSRLPASDRRVLFGFRFDHQKQKQEKLVSDSNQVALLKALLGFYDGFKDELGKRSSFSVWANMECSREKSDYSVRLPVKLFVSAYTLFNELKLQSMGL